MRVLLACGIFYSGWSFAVSQSNSTDGFADGSSDTRSVEFLVGDFGVDSTSIANIQVSISFAKHNASSFVPEGSALVAGNPFFNEIEFVLTSPAGTSVTLISNDGGVEINADVLESFNSGGSTEFSGTVVFNQSAAGTVNDNANMVQAGTFRPHPGNLDDFLNENAVGTWQLFFEDDLGSDGLSFYNVAININEAVTPPSGPSFPIPSLNGWGLISLTGLMMMALRRRRRIQAG